MPLSLSQDFQMKTAIVLIVLLSLTLVARADEEFASCKFSLKGHDGVVTDYDLTPLAQMPLELPLPKRAGEKIVVSPCSALAVPSCPADSPGVLKTSSSV